MTEPGEAIASFAYVARRAASKMRACYQRREVGPVAEFDDLIEAFWPGWIVAWRTGRLDEWYNQRDREEAQR